MKFLKYFALSVLFFLASCSSVYCPPNPSQETKDVISKPTNTVLARDTTGELPKGSWVKTDPDEKVEVVLEEDTVAVLKDPKVDSPVNLQQVVLPKNTQVILPENTYLQTSTPAKVKMDASTEVVLPQGTEITITRVNWYAILFYCLLVFGAAWYYMQGKNEDKNNDGFVDDKKE
jgi:hypothetical protein